jgi:hypothetical protein
MSHAFPPSQTGNGFSYFAMKVSQQMSTATTHTGVIVGIDGSPPSKVAVDWAAREASMRDLPLTIIPESACDVSFHSTSPRISFSSSRSLRN